MKNYIIKANDANQRLDKFILKLAPGLPKSMMHKMIRKKDIRLNGKRTEPSAILKEGDTVNAFIHYNFLGYPDLDFTSVPAEITVVYEDENILIADKPQGLLMHAGAEDVSDNLADRLLHYLYKKGEYSPENEQSFTPAFCNRIDRNTRGIVIAAKNFYSLQLINEKIRNQEITKKYICLVKGTLKEKSATLTGYHTKDGEKNMVKIHPNPVANGKLVETRYTVLKEYDNISLLEVELITGKSHQIREHLSGIGHPLVGDRKYGDLSGKASYQQLISYYLSFDFTSDSGQLEYLKGKVFTLGKPEELFSLGN